MPHSDLALVNTLGFDRGYKTDAVWSVMVSMGI
jgi:hypothetical protein